jgi:hypothetical protein
MSLKSMLLEEIVYDEDGKISQNTIFRKLK